MFTSYAVGGEFELRCVGHQIQHSFHITVLKSLLLSLLDQITNFCLAITLSNSFKLSSWWYWCSWVHLLGPLRAVPELKNNYQPRNQESECHVRKFFSRIAVCLKKKNFLEMQQQQIYQLLAVSSITEAQEKKASWTQYPSL